MILIDSRTGSAELAPYLKTPKIICHLDYADFAFTGNGPQGPVFIGVERKALLDLLGSMTSGRLSGHQLTGLRDAYDHVYLLVEGIWKADRRSGVLMRPVKRRWIPVTLGSRRFMARELYNFINTLAVICGVHVVFTSDPYETGQWLDATFAWWTKPWNKHTAHQQWHMPDEVASFTKPSLTARLWAQFDGVGQDRAQKLAERFRLPEDIIFATMEALMQIPGIGKKGAESIIRQRNLESYNAKM